MINSILNILYIPIELGLRLWILAGFFMWLTNCYGHRIISKTGVIYGLLFVCRRHFESFYSIHFDLNR